MKKLKKNKNEAIEAARLYQSWLIESDKSSSQHTVRAYETSMKFYIGFMEESGVNKGNFKIDDAFSRENIVKWIDWLKIRDPKKNAGSETCNNRLSHIRSFLEYLCATNIKYTSLYLSAKTIKKHRQKKKAQKGLSPYELEVLMKTPNTETKSGIVDLMIMSFLLGTAVRVGEMLRIQVKDFHMDTTAPYVFIQGKGNKERFVYLPDRLVVNIKTFIKMYHGKNPDQESFLFYSRVKGHDVPITETAVDKRLKKVANIARITCPSIPANLHAHQFRRTRATELAEKGFSPFQIAKILGHENLNTTMKYVHVSLSQKEKDLMKNEDVNQRTMEPEWEKRKDKLTYIFSQINKK